MAAKIQVASKSSVPNKKPSSAKMVRLRKLAGTSPASHALRRQMVDQKQVRARVTALREARQLLTKTQTHALLEEMATAMEVIVAYAPDVLRDFFKLIRSRHHGSLSREELSNDLLLIFPAKLSADTLTDFPGEEMKPLPQDAAKDALFATMEAGQVFADIPVFMDAVSILRRNRRGEGIAALTMFKANMDHPTYESVRMPAYLHALLSEAARETLSFSI